MKFKTHNEKEINCGGTSLIEEIDASYRDLVRVFGKPTDGDGYKVDAEWEIEFDDGIVATIYNYKDGKNYCGPSGTPKTKIREWHIGGHLENGEIIIQRILESIKNVPREKKLKRILKNKK